jgi:hypothetical protein
MSKTQVLPEDGGELGQRYLELVEAYKAGDIAHVTSLAANPASGVPAQESLHDFANTLMDLHPTGGRRYQDRATLFLGNAEYYAVIDGVRRADGWHFDPPYQSTSENTSSRELDCRIDARFPCGILTAPDALVAGVVQSHVIDQETHAPPLPEKLFDGFAVRMLDEHTGALKFTRVVFSGTGLDPDSLSSVFGFEDVQWRARNPIVVLDVARDARTARITYINKTSSPYLHENPSFPIDAGVAIESTEHYRIRGQLKTDIKDLAQFDVAFDVGTASECAADADRCDGN